MQGRLYAWRDPEPAYRSRHRDLEDFISNNFLPKPSPMVPLVLIIKYKIGSHMLYAYCA